MYQLNQYVGMMLDKVRVGAYAEALRREVRKDDVVLDVGCGLGVFCVLAARLGARAVYGVEPDASVHLAREVMRENGVADRVTLWRGGIQDIDLPERPTLVVADLRGMLPLDAGAAKAWNAVLPRMAPGARTIPRRDTVFVQPVTSEELDRRSHGCGPIEGVAFSSVRASVSSQVHAAYSDAVALAPERPVVEIRYDRPHHGAIGGRVEFEVDRPWTLDGFLVGFEAELVPGVVYRSFGPKAASAYGTGILPSTERRKLERGQRVVLRFEARVTDTGVWPLWAVEVDGREAPWQSPLESTPTSLDVMKAGLPGHVPGKDATDDLDAVILDAFREGLSVQAAGEKAVAALRLEARRTQAMERAAELARRRQGRVVRRLSPS